MKCGQRLMTGAWVAAACLAGSVRGQCQWSSVAGGIHYGSGKVGVGLSTMDAPFHVKGGSTDPSWQFGALMVSGGDQDHQLRFGVNTSGTPWGYIQSWVHNQSPQALILQRAGGNVGIGTTNSGPYRLAVEGTIGAREVIVTHVAWSDYEFRPGYRPRPLGEVERLIQKHRHLPGIPAERQVKAKGGSLGEMQAKLLAKVEELTLHLIRQEKQNRELRERVARLEQGVEAVR